MLHTLTMGSGPVSILALHGGLGWDHTALRPWLDPLAEYARLTYLDLLGCGRSAEPDDWDSVTHATWSDGVEEARRGLDATEGGHGRVVLFGHSYGAIIALEMARRHPGRVAGLILCAAPSAAVHVGAALARAQAHAVALGPDAEQALGALLAGPETDPAYQAVMADAIVLYAADPDAHELRAVVDQIRFRAAPMRRSFFELFEDYDARPDLSEIDVPALVLSGRHDWLAPPHEAPADFLAGLADSEGHVFEHSGHLPFVEETEEFVRVITDWLGRRTASLGPNAR